MNFWLVFLTGLTTGGLSCLAVQGGLLGSVIANQKQREEKERQPGIKTFDQLDWVPVGMFLGAKLMAHTILGGLLGLAGSVLTLSLPVRLVFQGFTALFMLATVGNLLDLHPLFRYVVLQPPRWVGRWVRGSAKSRAYFAPATLGLLTVLIPCGVTQAMEVVAINTGNPVLGAGTMAAFVLGTSPLFAIVGVATAKLSEWFREKFLRLAAAVLLGMAIYSLNGVLTVLDSPVTVQKLGEKLAVVLLLDNPYTGQVVANSGGVQRVNITVTNRGYWPNLFRVKAGVPVELTVETDNVYSCASAFTFRKFNIFSQLKPTDEKTFKFTPMEKGKFTFACAMGMYTGVMEVI